MKHRFAEELVADYKEKWEWSEAEKEPEGELMQRKMAEKAGECLHPQHYTSYNFFRSNSL